MFRFETLTAAPSSIETLEIGCHALEGAPPGLVRVFRAINPANEYISSIGDGDEGHWFMALR